MAEIPQQRYTDSGSTQASNALISRLDAFKNKFLDTANRENVRIGIRKAAEVEFTRGEDGLTDAPEFRKEGFFGAAQNKAYNQALQDGYVASLENDIRGELTRFSVEFSDDISAYESNVKAFRTAVAKEADPRVRSIALQSIDDKYARNYGSVLSRSRAKQEKIAYQETSALADSYLEEGRQSAQLGNLVESTAAIEAFNQTIDRQAEDGLITAPEAVIKKKEALAQIKQDTVVGTVKQYFDEGRPDEAIKSILDFRDRDIPELSLTERDTIAKAALEEVRQTFAIEGLLEKEEAAAIANLRQSAETELYLGISEGSIRPTDINQALRSGRIDLNQATKLNNILSTRGQGVDNYGLVLDIERRISSDQNPTQQIIDATGSQLSESTASRLLAIYSKRRDAAAKGGPGSFTNNEDFKAGKRFVGQALSVVGQYGVKTPEDQKRKAEAELLFYERSQDISGDEVPDYRGLAREVVSTIQAGQELQYYDRSLGSWDDPGGALKKLEERVRKEKLPYDFYLTQVQRIEARQNHLDALRDLGQTNQTQGLQ